MKVLYFYKDSCDEDILRVLEDSEVDHIGLYNAMQSLYEVDKYVVCVAPTLVFLDDDEKEVARLYGVIAQEDVKKILYGNM